MSGAGSGLSLEVWCSFHGHTLSAAPAVRQALSDAGSRARDGGWEDAPGPGIVFFEDPSDEVCAQLRIASAAGFHRVLAVSIGVSGVTAQQAWQLLQTGAADVLACSESAWRVDEIVERFTRWAAIDELLHSTLVRDNVVGRSPAWIATLRHVIEVARFTDARVLISGESGTGKELIARLVHTLDPRPTKGDLVVLDCTTIVPELAGSEFFGHERGAFTGAVSTRDGAFALANGGTLFLDEVGELPLPMQAQLLRVVQEGTHKRVGGNTWQRTDFRLLCATNRNLLDEVASGRFRRDLYYRIAAVTCHLPPLRERREDIPILIRHFLAQLRPQDALPDLDDPVRGYVLARNYPGNVRDLRQLVARMRYRHVGGGPITVGDVPPDERPLVEGESSDWRDGGFEHALRCALNQGVGLKEISRTTSDWAIRIAISEEQGNLQRAAKHLGVTDRALQMRRADSREKSGSAGNGYGCGGNGGDPDV